MPQSPDTHSLGPPGAEPDARRPATPPAQATQAQTTRPHAVAPVVVPAPPARRNPALAGRHVLVIAIEREAGLATDPGQVRALADHLAFSAEAVTLVSAIPHRAAWRAALAGRRAPGADPGARALGRAALVEVHYPVTAAHTAVTRAAHEANRLATAATAGLAHSPDLVIAGTPGLGAVVAAARVARRHRAPLLVVVADLVAGQNRFTAALESHALANADQVAIMDERFRDAVHRYGVAPERVHLLPAWSPLERSALGRREARAALGWATRGYVVLLAGPAGGRPGGATVVEAAALLGGRADVRFVLAGQDLRRPLRERARRLAGVRMTDLAGPAELATAIAAADVVLVEEDADGGPATAPGVLSGLLAAGRPLVAAVPDGGPTATALARTGGAALVVPPGDPAALASAVRLLLDEPHRRLAMADRALGHALAEAGQAAAMPALDAIVAASLGGQR